MGIVRQRIVKRQRSVRGQLRNQPFWQGLDDVILLLRFGRLAVGSGVSGLVCSPHECAPVRSALGQGPVLMVPGIRPAGADLGDQKRAATPAAAIAAGADLLVVGRPIRNAADPVAAADAVVAEIASALAT